MIKNTIKSPNGNKFTDKEFINFLKTFLRDLIFRSVPVTRNPPEKTILASDTKNKKGAKTYYKLILELTEENVFITRSTSSECEPDVRYTALSSGPTINNKTMDRLRKQILDNSRGKRDPTVARKKEDVDENITHMDLIMGLTCCIRLYGKLFTIEDLKKYFPNGLWEEMWNPTKNNNPILIDRMTIIGVLWAIVHMRRPFTFDSVSKSMFKEYFESAVLIEAQNLIYILSLGKKLELITNEKIEKSMENLASEEILSSLSLGDWIVALSCMENDNCKIVPKLMSLIVEEIDGMSINYCIVYLSALINMNASIRKYQISYRKVLSRIEKIFSNIPIDSNMSYIFYLLCQLSCDMKGFFESICTKVIRIMHLMPLTDMVKLMCAMAIYGRNCEKSVKDYEDPTRIESFKNLENYIINKIKNNPPFPKELMNIIHDSIIGGSKFSNYDDFCELSKQNVSYRENEKTCKTNNVSKDIFKNKGSIELSNETFKLSSEERVFCANILEDCCTNIKKLDSDAIMQLVYSLLTFKVDMAPLGTAVKRLVNESIMQDLDNEEMGFNVNLSNELGDIVTEYMIAETIISYAQRGKQIKDKIDFKDTKTQLEEAMVGRESSSDSSEAENEKGNLSDEKNGKEDSLSESAKSLTSEETENIEEKEEPNGNDVTEDDVSIVSSEKNTRKGIYTTELRRKRDKRILKSKLLGLKKTGVSNNINITPTENKIVSRRPQFSAGPKESADKSISLFPQFTSTTNDQRVQNRLQMDQMLLQHKLKLQEQMDMINQRLDPRVQERNPVYSNYQGYYGNNVNMYDCMKMNRQNNQGNKFGNDNKENYQMPMIPEAMSNPNFLGGEISGPHMNNPYPTAYPDYQVFNPHRYVESPLSNPQLVSQKLNNIHTQYNNDLFPKPSAISELKKQIRLIELEIEREKLKELERNMTYMNN